jgi:hypothetical protein
MQRQGDFKLRRSPGRSLIAHSVRGRRCWPAQSGSGASRRHEDQGWGLAPARAGVRHHWYTEIGAGGHAERLAEELEL